MRKAMTLFLVVVAVVGMTVTGNAAEYDRYERGSPSAAPPPPPPPRQAAPYPPQARPMYGRPYLYAQMGIYEPNDENDGLRGYDSGFSTAVAFGARLNPVFAVEGTLGGYYSEDDWGNEASVVPMTIGGRLIIPNSFVEPYLGGGFGVYFSSLDEPLSGIDDDSTDFGGYLSLGMDFWLNLRVALNFEGRYHWVDAAFFSRTIGQDIDVDLSGWTVNFGVRVSF
jgi:hypothetical protein